MPGLLVQSEGNARPLPFSKRAPQICQPTADTQCVPGSNPLNNDMRHLQFQQGNLMCKLCRSMKDNSKRRVQQHSPRQSRQTPWLSSVSWRLHRICCSSEIQNHSRRTGGDGSDPTVLSPCESMPFLSTSLFHAMEKNKKLKK